MFPTPCLGHRTLQEMDAGSLICMVSDATVVVVRGRGGGRTNHRAHSHWTQKHLKSQAAAARGEAEAGLSSRSPVAANQAGHRPRFHKTSPLPRHKCGQQEGGTSCHTGSHPLPMEALHPARPGPGREGSLPSSALGWPSPGQLRTGVCVAHPPSCCQGCFQRDYVWR